MPVSRSVTKFLLYAACFAAGMGAGAAVLKWRDAGPEISASVSAVTRQEAVKNQPPAGPLSVLRAPADPSVQLLDALRTVQAADAARLRKLLMNSPDLSAPAALALLKRWLELEPEAALEFCRLRRPELLPKLVGAWSVIRPAEAERYCLTLAPGELRTGAWLEMCLALSATAPGRTRELLERTPGLAGYRGTHPPLGRAIEKLAARNLEETLDRMKTMPPVLLAQVRPVMARLLMRADPGRGGKWALLPENRDLNVYASEEILKHDPAQALEFFKSIITRDPLGVPSAPPEWRIKDVKGFAALLEADATLAPADKQRLAGALLAAALQSDAENAGPLVALAGDLEHIIRAVGYFARHWFQQDKEGARAWIESLPPGAARDASSASWEEASKAEAALRKAEPEADLSPPTPLESLQWDLNNYVTIREEDPRLFTLTARDLDTLVRGTTANTVSPFSIIQEAASENPSAVAEWFQSAPADSETEREAVKFAGRWAERNPAAAAKWVAGLPQNGSLALVVVPEIARQYRRYAPDAAKAWAESLPPGPVRDAAEGER